MDVKQCLNIKGAGTYRGDGSLKEKKRNERKEKIDFMMFCKRSGVQV
jgi:hypothetical protein